MRDDRDRFDRQRSKKLPIDLSIRYYGPTNETFIGTGPFPA